MTPQFHELAGTSLPFGTDRGIPTRESPARPGATAVLERLPEAFQAGIVRHREIDAFTDAHRLFRQSIRRLPSPHRRDGGVLVDIFYDHYLAAEWPLFSDTPLPDFARQCYAAIAQYRDHFPENVQRRLRWIVEVDLLCSYQHIDGIAVALRGVSGRLRRHLDLSEAVAVLESRYDRFSDDFHRFFPELQRHLGSRSKTTDSPDANSAVS